MDSGQARATLGTAEAGQSAQVMVAADGVSRTFGSGHTPGFRVIRGFWRQGPDEVAGQRSPVW